LKIVFLALWAVCVTLLRLHTYLGYSVFRIDRKVDKTLTTASKTQKSIIAQNLYKHQMKLPTRGKLKNQHCDNVISNCEILEKRKRHVDK